MFTNKIICSDCNGSGYLPQYKHIQDGLCFNCGGFGLDEEISNEQQETPDPKEYYKNYLNDNKKITCTLNENECKIKLSEIELLVRECEMEWKKGNEDMFDKIDDLKSEYRDIQNQIKNFRKNRAKMKG